MNAAISSVIRTQSSNPASASKVENEAVKSAEAAAGGQNIAEETSVSSKFDTLELSQKYLAYRTQSENKALQDKTSQLNSTVIKKYSEEKKFQNDKKDSDEKDPLGKNGKKFYYYNPIYSYTEFELTQMYNDGTISRAEYEAEMESRELHFDAE